MLLHALAVVLMSWSCVGCDQFTKHATQQYPAFEPPKFWFHHTVRLQMGTLLLFIYPPFDYPGLLWLTPGGKTFEVDAVVSAAWWLYFVVFSPTFLL